MQDLLGLVLTSTRMRSRLYVTWSLPDLIKKYPQHVVALLGGLDFAPTPEKPWPHPLLGERALARADASSFASDKAYWGDGETGEGGGKARWLAQLFRSTGVEVPVQAKVLGLPGVLTDERLLAALCECTHLPLFDAKAVQTLLQWKWGRYGKTAHWAQTALYLVFVGCLSRWFYLVHTGSAAAGGAAEAQAAAWVAVVLVAAFVAAEVRQAACTSVAQYAAQGWNWVDVAALLMAGHQLCAWLAHPGGELSKVYAAATTVVSYTKILAYLRGAKDTAARVAMLSQVAWDTRGFVLILGIVIAAFSSGFFLLDDFDGTGEAVFSTVTIMLGEFYLDEGAGFQDVASRLFFLGFVVLVMILMLNLLIAIISDTFERVVEGQQAQFWRQLASLLQETEHLLPRLVSAAAPPAQCEWMHVLEPVSTDTAAAGDSWSGRVRQMKDYMDLLEKKLKQQVGQQVGKVEQQVGKVEQQVEQQVDEVKQQVDEVKQQVKQQVGKVEEQADEVKQQAGKVEQQVGEILALLLRQAPANGASSD